MYDFNYQSASSVDDAVSNPGEMTFDQFQAGRQGETNKPLDGRDFRNTILQLRADKTFWDSRITASLQGSVRVLLGHFYSTMGTFTDFADGFNPDTDMATTKSRQTSLIWQLGYQDEWDWLHNQSLLGMELVDESLYSLEQDAFLGNVVETTARETERSARPESVGLYWRETLKAAASRPNFI